MVSALVFDLGEHDFVHIGDGGANAFNALRTMHVLIGVLHVAFAPDGEQQQSVAPRKAPFFR